ncbi:LexA regulated protein [Aliidiomarina maris]|uniref:LexA regulated protein n=1 Tax=Aliidiomarina maris TaxID=531312 RepID=A0A327WUD1_9GAMM|nr:LexA regulated protein [Aliidiomarina maris]MBA3988731.1 LexA regulated protein [Idiomarina sp.]MCL5049809.1 LexA regulated protein [Bacillota bacterium]RAJ96472.1 ribbon-helix-helix CopG family protein [Aliidiomarina maris]RUO23775.1 LexA regulated protein [Aliidiomarina maris]
MAKESTDNVTIDLFQSQRRPGRPKTNPLSRAEQMKLNKRRQHRRDRARGLKRIELKVEESVYVALNQSAEAQGMSRSQLIERILTEAMALTDQDV